MKETIEDQRKLEEFTLEYGDRIVKRLIESFEQSRDPVVIDQILICPTCKQETRRHQLTCCGNTWNQFVDAYVLSNGITIPVREAAGKVRGK